MSCYKQCGPHPDDDDFFINVELKQSTASEAPETFTHGKNPSQQDLLSLVSLITAYFTASISTSKTIRVPIDSIPGDRFEKKTRNSNMEPYWVLEYQIVLEVNNCSIEFWIEIRGQQYGKVAIN